MHAKALPWLPQLLVIRRHILVCSRIFYEWFEDKPDEENPRNNSSTTSEEKNQNFFYKCKKHVKEEKETSALAVRGWIKENLPRNLPSYRLQVSVISDVFRLREFFNHLRAVPSYLLACTSSRSSHFSHWHKQNPEQRLRFLYFSQCWQRLYMLFQTMEKETDQSQIQ